MALTTPARLAAVAVLCLLALWLPSRIAQLGSGPGASSPPPPPPPPATEAERFSEDRTTAQPPEAEQPSPSPVRQQQQAPAVTQRPPAVCAIEPLATAPPLDASATAAPPLPPVRGSRARADFLKARSNALVTATSGCVAPVVCQPHTKCTPAPQSAAATAAAAAAGGGACDWYELPRLDEAVARTARTVILEVGTNVHPEASNLRPRPGRYTISVEPLADAGAAVWGGGLTTVLVSAGIGPQRSVALSMSTGKHSTTNRLNFGAAKPASPSAGPALTAASSAVLPAADVIDALIPPHVTGDFFVIDAQGLDLEVALSAGRDGLRRFRYVMFECQEMFPDFPSGFRISDTATMCLEAAAKIEGFSGFRFVGCIENMARFEHNCLLANPNCDGAARFLPPRMPRVGSAAHGSFGQRWQPDTPAAAATEHATNATVEAAGQAPNVTEEPSETLPAAAPDWQTKLPTAQCDWQAALGVKNLTGDRQLAALLGDADGADAFSLMCPVTVNRTWAARKCVLRPAHELVDHVPPRACFIWEKQCARRGTLSDTLRCFTQRARWCVGEFTGRCHQLFRACHTLDCFVKTGRLCGARRR